MTTGLMLSGSATVAGYMLLIGVIALIASAHPDEKRRADASKVLDKLLRRSRP